MPKHPASITLSLASVLVASCGAEAKEPPPRPITARLALGSIPQWNEGVGIAHGTCSATFANPTTPLGKPGRIEATCSNLTLAFQVDPVARIGVSLASSHESLLGDTSLDAAKPPFVLDHAHPEHTIALSAEAYASDGARLHARQPAPTYTPAAGCAAIAKLDALGDTLTIRALAAGTCTIDVAWLGQTTSTSIVVR